MGTEDRRNEFTIYDMKSANSLVQVNNSRGLKGFEQGARGASRSGKMKYIGDVRKINGFQEEEVVRRQVVAERKKDAYRNSE